MLESNGPGSISRVSCRLAVSLEKLYLPLVYGFVKRLITVPI